MFINMSTNVEQVNISDLIHNDNWDPHSLRCLFGENLNYISSSLGIIDSNANNHWVWHPKSHCSKSSAVVYHHLNQNIALINQWIGWKKLWEIRVAPCVKHFLWLIFKGRLTTYDYLYRLQLGPNNPYILCGTEWETIEYLFIQCSRSKWFGDRLAPKSIRPIHSLMDLALKLGSLTITIQSISFQ